MGSIAWWSSGHVAYVENGDGRDDIAALYAYPDNTAFNVFAGTPTGLASTWERRWTSSTNGWDWSRTK